MALGTAFGLPTESEIDLAELLVDRLPAAEQIRFTNSGTEAVEGAIKMARALGRRIGVLLPLQEEGLTEAIHAAFAEFVLRARKQGWLAVVDRRAVEGLSKLLFINPETFCRGRRTIGKTSAFRRKS